MLLRHLYLYLNLEEYPKVLTTPFGFRTRYVCNFLERRFVPLRFCTDDYSKLLIQGTLRPDAPAAQMPESALVVPVEFDRARYESLSGDEHHEFFISMLLVGFKKAAATHPIPRPELEGAVEEFRAGGYRNLWIAKEKTLRSARIKAKLSCTLDSEKFQLTLEVSRNSAIVYSKVILETKPDEIIFGYRFKNLVFEGNMIRVLDKFGKETFAVDSRTF